MRILKRIAFLVAALVIFCSCSTPPPIVLDDSLPEEEQATVLFSYGIIVTSYNGIPFETPRGGTCLKIPQGKCEFTCDLDASNGYMSWTGKDFILTYTFEGNKEYYLSFRLMDRKWGADIYNGLSPSDDTLIEFVPFSNTTRNFSAK